MRANGRHARKQVGDDGVECETDSDLCDHSRLGQSPPHEPEPDRRAEDCGQRDEVLKQGEQVLGVQGSDDSTQENRADHEAAGRDVVLF